MKNKKLIDILAKELKKNNIEFTSEQDMMEKLDEFTRHYSYEKIIRKLIPSADEKFVDVLDRLSLEQIIALKLEISSKKTGQVLLPKWFFSSLEDVLKFIIIKYVLGYFGSFRDAMEYLEISKEELEHGLRKHNLFVEES